MRGWWRANVEIFSEHGHLGRGGHGLPKVSPGAALPYPCMSCGRPLAVFFPFGHPMPYAYVSEEVLSF
jgi:hypothetical protein